MQPSLTTSTQPDSGAPRFEAIWVTRSFLRALDALTRHQPSLRARIWKVLDQYLVDTAPLHRTPLHNPKYPIFHTRIDGEKRLVDQPLGPDLPREIAALYVGHHDDANNWGSRYDQDTLAVLEKARRLAAEMEQPSSAERRPQRKRQNRTARHVAPGTYAEFLSREDLDRLHVPKQQIQVVLDARTADGLAQYGIDPAIADQIEALFLSRVPGAPLPLSVPDIEEPAGIRVTREELPTLLRLPLHRLLATLTDEQRSLVQRKSRKLHVVKGAAGSGKTVIGIRRIEFLRRQSELFDRPILFICYNQVLADAVRQMLYDVLREDPAPAGVSVQTAYQLIWSLRQELCPGIKTKPVGEQELLRLLREVRKATRQGRELRGWTDGEIVDEIREVLLGRAITEESTYLDADRTGRGRRLDRKTREVIWSLFRVFYLRCHEEQSVAWEQLVVDVLVTLKRSPPTTPRFAAIVVDEAQDLPPSVFQTLLHLQAGSDEDILILGDAAQNIYRSSFRWSHTGLRVAGGQVSILRRSFRSTPQIAAAAAPLVASQEPRFEDDLVLPEGAGDSGPPVQVHLWPTQEDELLGVALEIESMIRTGVPPSSIGVLGDRRTREQLRQYLGELGCACEDFIKKADGSKHIDLFHPSVKLLTRSSAKGIEFPVLFIPRATEWAFPASDSDGERADRARRDLYTAMMRCAWTLQISSTHAKRTKLLEELGTQHVQVHLH